jgi:hypothetical protein
LLKLQYVRIFKKSQSFVHKIMQPISLFATCLTQMIFVLCHPSVLFLVLLGFVMAGFFITLADNQGRDSFTFKMKIILCLEALYVVLQYNINIFAIDGLQEVQQKEELTILLGMGTQQQLGYFEQEVNIFDSLFPFNLSILFLLLIAIFTRYMGKKRHQFKARPA